MSVVGAAPGLRDPGALVRAGRLLEALRLLVAPGDMPLPGQGPGASASDTARAGALLVECRLARGETDVAQRTVAALDRAAHDDPAADLPEVRMARAELSVARGETDLAVERFLAVPAAPGRLPGPVADLAVPWRAGIALALLRAGCRAEALDLARHQHALASEHGDGFDRALALRVLAATDPVNQRVARLREALRLLDDVPAARLHAQIAADLAGVLMLTPDAAGEADGVLPLLRDAEAYAVREELWPLQSRVRRLLALLGEQPRRTDAEALATLSAGERRVAVLAIDGRSNREIATHLAISVKAVEGHLSRAYRKLGVASRAGLVAAVPRPRVET